MLVLDCDCKTLVAHLLPHFEVFTLTEPPEMTRAEWKGCIPVGVLFAVVLYAGNSAYLYLSVSFIQMIKAAMPVCVYLVGVLLGSREYSHQVMLNMVVISACVQVTCAAEVKFELQGFVLQLSSIVCESFRLVLIERLLHGLKFNSITTLYIIAPICALALVPGVVLFELPHVLDAIANNKFSWSLIPILLGNCCCAICLNLAVFLLIGKTSALTMNLAAVAKDVVLVTVSLFAFGDPVTGLQVVGFTGAILAVLYYNRSNQLAKEAKAAADLEAKADADVACDFTIKEDDTLEAVECASLINPQVAKV